MTSEDFSEVYLHSALEALFFKVFRTSVDLLHVQKKSYESSYLLGYFDYFLSNHTVGCCNTNFSCLSQIRKEGRKHFAKKVSIFLLYFFLRDCCCLDVTFGQLQLFTLRHPVFFVLARCLILIAFWKTIFRTRQQPHDTGEYRRSVVLYCGNAQIRKEGRKHFAKKVSIFLLYFFLRDCCCLDVTFGQLQLFTLRHPVFFVLARCLILIAFWKTIFRTRQQPHDTGEYRRSVVLYCGNAQIRKEGRKHFAKKVSIFLLYFFLRDCCCLDVTFGQLQLFTLRHPVFFCFSPLFILIAFWKTIFSDVHG